MKNIMKNKIDPNSLHKATVSFVNFLYERDGIVPKESAQDVAKTYEDIVTKSHSDGSDYPVFAEAAALAKKVYADESGKIRPDDTQKYNEFIKAVFRDNGIEDSGLQSESQEKSKPTYNAR